MAAALIDKSSFNDLLFFGGIILAAWAGIHGWNWFVRHRAKNWTEVEGRFESGNVHGFQGVNSFGTVVPHKSGNFTAELNYSYRVQGDYYAGSIRQHFDDEQLAWDFVNANKGKGILVHYQSKNPDKSLVWKVMGEVNHAR